MTMTRTHEWLVEVILVVPEYLYGNLEGVGGLARSQKEAIASGPSRPVA